MPGQLLLLMGEDLTQYHIWDGMRAIDYLLTRPEVDPRRIGCAGHSGGGTMTMFLSALDERVRCAVVNEGGTGHRWPMRVPSTRFGPSDVEQNLFPAALYGIDLCDVLASIAPRPLLTLVEEYNPHFDAAAAHIRRRYEQLEVPDHFGTGEATDPHAWTLKLRLATTAWFSHWFYSRPGPAREPDFEPEKPADLFCVPGGSLLAAHKGQSIWTVIQAKAARLPPRRSAPPAPDEIAKVLRYLKRTEPLGTRHLVDTPRRGYRVEKIEFLSEPGIYIPAWVFVPESPKNSPVTLYFDERGKEKEGEEFGLYERLARKGMMVIAADVRGIGSTAPPQTGRGTGDFAHLFSVDAALTYMAWFMDESLFGQRVADVIRTVDYAAGRVDVRHEGLRVAGVGAGALWALYAAALDSRIKEVYAERPLISYRALTTSDRYLHGSPVFLRDVLLHFDLPQVAAAIRGRVTLISPVDHMNRPVELSIARAQYPAGVQITGGPFELD
jgi:cephalosporin-C deacetylase-like acetyl esterase